MARLKAFTVRLPQELVDKIDARAKSAKRTRNSEIEQMVEDRVDADTKTS